MEDQGGSKMTGIRQIVRLKMLVQKWQSLSLRTKTNNQSNNNHVETSNRNESSHGGISPAISKRIKSPNVYWDSDEDSCQSPASCQSPETPHGGVPRGFLAVYVGSELRRFIIPTSYLSDPLFKVLLEKAEEEFGFDHCGGLTLPCEIETFKYLLKCMENHQRDHSHDQQHSGSTLPE